MKSTKLLTMFAAVLTLFATAACNTTDHSDVGPIPPNTLYDFATLTSNTDKGSIFTLTKANDSQPVTYTSSVKIDTNKGIKVGDRLVIAYTTTEGLKAYQSGPINLIGYILMDNASMTVANLEGAWSSSPLDMEVITRTGTYINMQMKLYARNNITRGELRLVADPNKLDAAVPELFLVYDNPQNFGDNKYLAYASFDIADIWTRATCKGVKITYQTVNGIKSTTFENNDVVKPEPID